MGIDHLYSHMHEKYFVPSLLMKAIETIPISRAAQHVLGYFMNYHNQKAEYWEDIARDQIKKSLRRYMYQKLGIAR